MESTKQKDIHQEVKRTLKDSFIYLPARVIPAIVGILLIRILTSVFSPAEYGYYQITLSTLGFLRVFGMVWLANSVTRFYLIHKNDHQENIFFSTLFIISVTGAVAVAAIAWCVNFLFFQSMLDPTLFSLINLAIGASIFNAFFEIFVMVFRAGLEPKKYSVFWVLFAVGKPLLGIALILLFGFRVDGIFWGFIIVPLILDGIIMLKLKLFKHLSLKHISKTLMKQFAHYGIPFSLSFFAFWVLTLSDRYLIGYFHGSAQVGLYSVGYTISEKTLNFIYMVLMLAAYPVIVDNYEKHGDERAQSLITELTRYFFLICVPILAILLILPDRILAIFSSGKFLDGSAVLPFIAIGVFLNGLSAYVLKGFELHKKSRMIAVLALSAGAINVTLNLILIPRMGFIGAGISACTAYTCYFIFSVVAVRQTMAWKPPLASLARIGLAGVTMSLFFIFTTQWIEGVWQTILFIMPGGLIVFSLALFLMREIRPHELSRGVSWLNGLIRKSKM